VKAEKPFSIITRYQNKQILPLKLKPKGWLHFHQLVSVQSGKVIVEDCAYRYSLSHAPRDEQQWIFRYDYRLNPEDKYPHAHLHLNANRGDDSLRHLHFPTGRVSIEQVIAHLIIEHGVKPKREDWFEFLAKSHYGFAKRRTDPPLFP